MTSVLAALIAFLLSLAVVTPASLAASDDAGAGAHSGEGLEKSLTTFRGVGDEIEIIGLQEYPGGHRKFLGLMRNQRDILYTGEVTQITGDWHHVHFFRDRTSAYILFKGGPILKIPGGMLSERDFEVFDVSKTDLPEGLEYFTGRGLRVFRADGSVDEYLVEMSGSVHQRLAGEGAEPRWVEAAQFQKIEYPYVSLRDYVSWFGTQHEPADPSRTTYEIHAVSPDEKDRLIYDHLKILPDQNGYRALSETHVAGRDQVRRRGYEIIVGPRYHLSTVYHIFRMQAEADRSAFDEKLMEKIQSEDATIGADRMLYVWATDQLDRTVGMVRLTQGYEAAGFISKDHRIPVERSHGHLDVRGKFPGQTVYEMNRLGIRKDLASFVTTKQLFSTLAQYMDVRNLPEGVIIFHTDDFGASFFPQLIDTIPVYGPHETRDGTHVLSVSTKTFKEKVLSASPGGAPIRDLHHPEDICSALLK